MSARLTPLEVASGLVPGGAPVVLPPTGLDARAAIEAVLLEAMAERPATVSFSGGRDSSVVLALATHVARREGLADPVPVTLRFPGAAESDESGWQEGVVGHLGLTDWERVEIIDELDMLGPVATEALRRRGVQWPMNAHFHAPLFARSPGRVLFTGIDGDSLFDGWRWRASHLHPLSAATARRVAGRALPTPVRVARSLRGGGLPGWLDDDARRAVARRQVDAVREPWRWDRRLAWFRGRRYLEVSLAAIAGHADDHGARVAHPLIDPRALAGLAGTGGRAGWPDRTTALTDLVGDLLPPGLLTRGSKARFTGAFLSPSIAAFAATWSGRGVPHAAADRLRAAWSSPRPDLRSLTALHAAWLADADPPARPAPAPGGDGQPDGR